MRHLSLILCVMFLQNIQSYGQSNIDHKIYDTEFGRFDLWISGNQIAGSYQIAPKGIIGSVWAELEGNTATGRWNDPDGTGDIILTFKNGFDSFAADYRADKEPDKWYRNQWHATIQKVKASKEVPCSGPSYQLIQPFIGTWEEYELDADDNEEFIGTLRVELTAGGCALSQRFVSQDSTFFYATQGYVNRGSGIWEEKYVFSNGATADYQWIVDQGDIVQRRIGGTRQIDYLHQLRFTEVTKQGYLLFQEQSTDGGKSWVSNERTRVKRKEFP